jgi:hypothetical protein
MDGICSASPATRGERPEVVGALLLRGMLVGVVAGILSFGFLKIVGEPPVERAIAFEAQHEAVSTHSEAHGNGTAIAKPELVSRTIQSGLGLLIGVVIYGAAVGGLFALAFALAYDRIGDFGPRATAALLAVLGIVAIYVVPSLKYPASPPSVGEADTIGMRTALYFSMIALSLATMILAGMLRVRLQPRLGGWNAVLVASAAYLTAITAVALALPAVDEVPGEFPATVLWQFRVAAAGAQLILWATLGLAFGVLAERAVTNRGGSRSRMAAL